MIVRYGRRVGQVWSAPANRGGRIRALTRAAGWFVHRRTSQRPWERTVFGDRKFLRYPDSNVATDVVLYGDRYASDEFDLIERFLRPGDDFLDVGANVGLFSLLASRLTDRITCVEPGGEQRQRLQENLRRNGIDATVHGVAASDRNDTLSFSQGDSVAHVLDGVTDAGLARKTAETVDARRLDDVLADRFYTFCKLDVEGHELAALRGAAGLIERGRLPAILLEVNGSARRYGVPDAAPLDFLRERGYTIGVYGKGGVLDTTADLWDDVLALDARGIEMFRERCPAGTIIR